ncbi:phage minor head protein [Martelella sp. HB161492]|uniref:phage minor head protein n=1 Tax=Martelella sp. HB161492 TaxID=2720726 RepID=UPI001590E25D|nr:phage minor head protein [Martelella sp. HB161492]
MCEFCSQKAQPNRGSSAYRQAFEAYLRYGTPIPPETKEAPSRTSHYIWRTMRDDRVRASHAANDGNIYAFDNPPVTGNPGEAYGCRCIAEPYDASTGEYFDIRLSGVSDATEQWPWWRFAGHYFTGHGKPVTVRETGYLSEVVLKFQQEAIDNPLRLPGQIADRARTTGEGDFVYGFEGNYEMQQIVFSIGTTTISGTASGSCRRNAGMLELDGDITFELTDMFRDPYDAESYYKWLHEAAGRVVDAIASGLDSATEIAGRVSLNSAMATGHFLRWCSKWRNAP